MMLLFLERMFILFKSFMMRGVDISLYCNGWRTDFEVLLGQ